MDAPENPLLSSGEPSKGGKATPNAGAFIPGRSGNPAGRPKGSRNRNTKLAQAFAVEHGEELLRMAWAHAYEDPSIVRFLLERVFPKAW